MALIRPFVPSRDFAASLAFYEAIGFTATYRGEDLAILEQDGAGLLLQRYDAPGFADNAMHQLFVDDLDGWWTRTARLQERFGVRAPAAPVDKPEWGLRVGFLWDPAGVLWHVCETLSQRKVGSYDDDVAASRSSSRARPTAGWDFAYH